VGRLHVTAVIGARPACGLAQEVYDVTENLLQRFRAVADEEALQLRVAGQAGNEIVGDSRRGACRGVVLEALLWVVAVRPRQEWSK